MGKSLCSNKQEQELCNAIILDKEYLKLLPAATKSFSNKLPAGFRL